MQYQKYLDEAAEELQKMWPESLIIHSSDKVVEVYKDKYFHGYLFRYDDSTISVETNFIGNKKTSRMCEEIINSFGGLSRIFKNSYYYAIITYLREEIKKELSSLVTAADKETLTVWLPEHKLLVRKFNKETSFILIPTKHKDAPIENILKDNDDWNVVYKELLWYVIEYG